MSTIKLPKDAPGRLAAVGEFLYGQAYRKRLAKGLGICRDTLWSWMKGAAKAHWDIDGELIRLLESERDACAARGMAITEIRKQLMSRRKP
ncbi:hypothetical protein BF49_5615 [Bradyrhizobium sp.]|uniref:hypothetical protein n=1 Tax=Bradyrhizobium sp. TaxID=376 RepID=UPI0007C1E64E|nr:hypothetical protein [Bradyrhizobium sp.]CUT14535.1 hypothetical protein BF49_5615 [Bradyrhizobium sp.]